MPVVTPNVADGNAAITALNQQQSPLLRLPAELRNQVYGYVFSHLEFKLDPADDCWEKPATNPWNKRSEHALALTATCRQVHEEAMLLPFVHASFLTEPFSSNTQTAIRMDFSLEQRNAIRNARVYLNEYNFQYYGHSPYSEDSLQVLLEEIFEVLPGVKDVQICDFSIAGMFTGTLRDAVAKMEGVSMEIGDHGAAQILRRTFGMKTGISDYVRL